MILIPWQRVLLDWGIPILLGGTLAVVTLLVFLNQVAPAPSILILGVSLLLLVVFFPLKTALSDGVEARLKMLVIGFGLAVIVVTCVQLYFAIFVGEAIISGAVAVDGEALKMPLNELGTAYELVVEGSFAAAAGQVGRESSYVLTLEKDGQKIQEFSGVFSERWGRQRLGRRGSTTTHQLHNHSLHVFTSPGEGVYELAATRVDPQLSPALSVFLYRDTYPEKTFWFLSALLLIGAYVVEVLFATREIPFVLVTTAVLVFVVTFRNLGVPPHNYQDLVGAVMIAAIVGPLGGWIFRVIADLVGKSLGFSRPQPVVSGGGKGKGTKR
jgi:hypothetical protein